MENDGHIDINPDGCEISEEFPWPLALQLAIRYTWTQDGLKGARIKASHLIPASSKFQF